MSSITTYTNSDIQWTSTEPTQYFLPTNGEIEPSEAVMYMPSIPAIEVEMFNFFNKRAGLVAASLYKTLQQIVQTSLVSTIYVSAFNEVELDLDLEHDIWVDMPPLCTKKVAMKARNAGKGQPLASLGPLAED